ncbi:MAG: Mur ligase family protein [Exilispira sp.]
MDKLLFNEFLNYLSKKNIDFEIIDSKNLKDKIIIKDICIDTRKIKKEDNNFYLDNNYYLTDIFIAIKGEKYDSHKEIKTISPFFKVIVIENNDFLEENEDLYSFSFNNNLVIIKSQNTRSFMAYIYKFKFDLIDEKMNIFAFTGTDGKTSMVNILHLLFSKLFGLSASIGTLGVNINGEKYNFQQTTPTTPEIYDIFYILTQLSKIKVSNIFIEATSIASSQKRLESLSLDSLSFTNMTSDHLDFHTTLENYYNSKLSYINQLSNSEKKNRLLFYNLDDLNYYLIENELKKYKNIMAYNYGFNQNADFKISKLGYENRLLVVEIELSNKLLKISNITENKKIISIKTNLIGRVNAYNIAHSLAYILVLSIINYNSNPSIFYNLLEESREIFSNITIPGRMERIEFMGSDIFIDYAHTADSLKNAILSLKEAGYKNVITVMGCGGDRDKSKRPLMGKSASQFSTFTIITSDNPRGEEPEDIIKDILKGVINQNYIVCIDRQNAIEKGIDLLKKAEKPTALLIAGKGHEDYQEIKGVKYHFSDKEVVKSIINRF